MGLIRTPGGKGTQVASAGCTYCRRRKMQNKGQYKELLQNATKMYFATHLINDYQMGLFKFYLTLLAIYNHYNLWMNYTCGALNGDIKKANTTAKV